MNRLSFLEFVCFLKKCLGFLMEVFITTVLILKECSRTRDSAQEIASLSLSFDDREVESKCRGLPRFRNIPFVRKHSPMSYQRVGDVPTERKWSVDDMFMSVVMYCVSVFCQNFNCWK